MILGVFCFGFRRVSLAEYILVLRVYFLLLQMTFYIRDSISIVSTRQVMKTRSWAWSLFSCLNAFAGCDQRTSMCIWTRVCELNYLLPLLYKTCFVITMTLRCCNLSANYLWNVVMYDVLCWITMILVLCKLVWNPSWFQLTTGFIWAQVREFDHFGDCFCTCALINWSVLW